MSDHTFELLQYAPDAWQLWQSTQPGPKAKSPEPEWQPAGYVGNLVQAAGSLHNKLRATWLLKADQEAGLAMTEANLMAEMAKRAYAATRQAVEAYVASGKASEALAQPGITISPFQLGIWQVNKRFEPEGKDPYWKAIKWTTCHGAAAHLVAFELGTDRMSAQLICERLFVIRDHLVANISAYVAKESNK